MKRINAPLPSTPRNLLVSPKSQSPIAVAPISKNNNKDDVTDSNQANNIIKAIILGGQLVGRAFAKALKNEFQAGRAAQANKNQSNETVQANRISGMSLEEAKQILNIKELDENILKERYEHLFNANNKSKGGSFYIQSKIYRAKERLDDELKIEKTK